MADHDPTADSWAIQCEGVEVRYRQGRAEQRVLDRLSLSVSRGEVVSLLGPSGCGKSTLLRVIAGLIDPTSGAVRIDGQDVRAARSKLAFVFQESALLPWRSVWQNVRLPCELRRDIAGQELSDRIEHALQLVGFKQADWHKKPSQLSGGMKMRASIARALITQPQILLMDEPFAALDDMLRSKLNDLLLSIVAESGCTLLFVTHNISEAIYLSHAIAIMSQGRIAQKCVVDLPFPRSAELRSRAEFAEQYGMVLDTLTRSDAR